jgi:Predicted membrane protein (DUF2306)
MQITRSTKLPNILTNLAVVLILKVTVGVVLKYRDYFPPNFNSDFLRGRGTYFFGAYQWAFYAHLASGPVSLVLGLILISDRFRSRFPKWHRLLGRIQVVVVLLIVAPSGLWMAYRAESGPVAAVGFASMAIVTGACVAMGLRCAVKRRFPEHRRWMWRCFLLLCAAVVIRVIGGLATVAEVQAQWIYTLSAWASWLAPLIVFEFVRARNRHMRVPFAPPVLATSER